MKTAKITNKPLVIGALKFALDHIKCSQDPPLLIPLVDYYGFITCARHTDMYVLRIEFFEWVVSLLDGWNSYASWLEKNCPKYRELDSHEQKIAAEREGLIAWGEWMIAQLEAAFTAQGGSTL